MVLANTYHLALRPGEDVVARLGGLHGFMGWYGPILTDSGGFQVFSLAARSRLSEDGVAFRSHIDGRLLELTPERAIAIQEALGADVAMCLDHCPALPATKEAIADAVGRTIRWAGRCRGGPHARGPGPLRDRPGGAPRRPPRRMRRGADRARLRRLRRRGRQRGREPRAGPRGPGGDHAPPAGGPAPLPDGGRPPAGHPRRRRDRHRPVRLRPADPQRPQRHLPDRPRAGQAPQRRAPARPRPIEDGCPCLACRNFSRAYLRHLFLAKEMLGPILASIHNVAYLHRLTRRIRQAITEERFVPLRAEVLEALGP